MQCNCNSQVIDFCKNFMCHTRCKKSDFFFSLIFDILILCAEKMNDMQCIDLIAFGNHLWASD